jgi:transaldolase
MAFVLDELVVKIYADGADKAGMLTSAKNPLIKGFTTNPTLMRKAGISDYGAFAKDILSNITDRPISFEVFSDDFDEMYDQAQKISSWGNNVYVKIPIMNTEGKTSARLLEKLAPTGIKINVTAIFTREQIEMVSEVLAEAAPCNISVFAGRIADAGEDPLPIMKYAMKLISSRPQQELIWASPREIYNVVQAHEIGCHIITVTNDLISKLPHLGKNLHQFSLETVQMFRTDSLAAGFII